MIYKDNPFYILNVSLTDNRRKITSQAEEMSFNIDEKICNEAQSILLNPQKRINAELCWFLGVEKNIVSQCISLIKNNNLIDIVFEEDISDLIANINNLSTINHIAKKDLINNIICYVKTINDLFDCIDIYDLLDTVNEYRSKANFPEATEEEIQAGLEYVRKFAKDIIQSKVKLISSNKEDLITFANNITKEKVIKGLIFEDIIDEYELQVSTDINDIEAKIKNNTSRKATKNSVKELASLLSKWQDLVKPIYNKYENNGSLDYRYSNFLNEVRSYIIDISNKDMEVLLSFVLLKYLKYRINLCKDINELVNNDYKVIDEIVDNLSIRSYCNILYNYITGQINDSNVVATKQDLAEAIRNSSVSSTSSSYQSQYSESNNNGCWWVIGIIVVIIIICSIVSSCNNGEDSSYSSSSTSTAVSSESVPPINIDNESKVETEISSEEENEYDNEYVDTSNLDSTGEQVRVSQAVHEKANEMERKLSILKRELDDYHDDVDRAREKCEEAKDNLESLKNQYDLTGDEYYLNEYNNNVEDCNDLSRNYNSMVAKYKEKQNAYNSKVDEYNRYLREHSLN